LAAALASASFILTSWQIFKRRRADHKTLTASA
jgi:hypothetical protein